MGFLFTNNIKKKIMLKSKLKFIEEFKVLVFLQKFASTQNFILDNSSLLL